MPYWQLYYHLVWFTAGRLPLLTPEVEPTIYGFMRSKAADLGGLVFALNGTLDHVHMLAAIPPKIAVARFVGQVKGVAASRANQLEITEPRLYWQGEYGVFSFDAKRLPNFVAYVERQKEHHRQGSLIPVLERTDGPGVSLLADAGVEYTLTIADT